MRPDRTHSSHQHACVTDCPCVANQLLRSLHPPPKSSMTSFQMQLVMLTNPGTVARAIAQDRHQRQQG
jgi:hypothetical protein